MKEEKKVITRAMYERNDGVTLSLRRRPPKDVLKRCLRELGVDDDLVVLVWRPYNDEYEVLS